MKLSMIVSLSLLSTIAFAQNDAKFSEHKKMASEEITQQITAMQTLKSCIDGAADHDAMKKCHETAKAERKKIEAQKIDMHIKALQDKKKEIEEKK